MSRQQAKASCAVYTDSVLRRQHYFASSQQLLPLPTLSRAWALRHPSLASAIFITALPYQRLGLVIALDIVHSPLAFPLKSASNHYAESIHMVGVLLTLNLLKSLLPVLLPIQYWPC